MDVKEKISEMKALMRTAERLALELDDAMNATPKSPRFDGMPRGNNQTTLDLQAEIIERARDRFEKARENALEKLNEIEEMIDSLESYDQQKVLYFRYIYRMKWAEVADRIHFSERQAQRIHARALEALAKVIIPAERSVPICPLHSDDEVTEYCVEGPCVDWLEGRCQIMERRKSDERMECDQ